MKNKKQHFPAPVIGAIALAFSFAVQAENDLEGGWIVSSWENPGGAAIQDAQPGIFIFTSTNYVFMYVNTAEPRPGYDAEAGMTDAEKMAAYDSLTANAGGYEIDGSKFTTYAYVAKDTNYMGGFPENGVEHEFVRDGDALTITGTSGPNPFKVVLERVEGEDGPWETQ